MGMSWRIDAWAVRDGVAFASDREELADIERLEARNTVFLSVPDLEPVPVGRISTALRATRGNFQAGFYDGEGNEIVLPTLEDVQALVRRAYLASGIGDEGAAAPPLPFGTPPSREGGAAEAVPHVPEPPSADFLEGAIDRLDVLLELDPLSMPEARTSLVDLEGEGWSELAGLVRGYALDVSLAWERRVAQRPTDVDGDLLASWYLLLAMRGIWDAGPSEAPIDLQEFPVGRIVLGALAGTRNLPATRITPGYATRPAADVLAQAPAPLREGWHTGIRRLTDKLYLALAVGDYFHHNPRLPELAPSLLAALALTGGDRAALNSPGRLERHLQAALRWLWEELPRPLPAAAEEALDEYGWRQLERPSPTTSGPGTREAESSVRPDEWNLEAEEGLEAGAEGSAEVAGRLLVQTRSFLAG